MPEALPLVTVGMPVRNGRRFIREAIESILAQTMPELELVICDNCSTDNTEEICREYMARDSRVRYFRNERNLGPAENHNRCIAHARGKYFRWNAHDDILDPKYLEKVIAVLEQDLSVANCHCHTRRITEDGSAKPDYIYVIGTDHPSLPVRFRRLINVNHKTHWEYEIFGTCRLDQVKQCPGQMTYAHGDRIHLVRMVLFGRFVEVPELLFTAREHSGQSLALSTRRSKYLNFLGTGPIPPAEWWNPDLKGKATWPEWFLLSNYWRMVGEVKMPWHHRQLCRLFVLEWALRNSHKLFRDVAFGVEHALLHDPDATPSPTPAGPTLIDPGRVDPYSLSGG